VICALLAGALAGYAIAIPVGVIAVLIVETGVQRGFRVAAAAGAGAATADLLYASLAMAGGAAIGPILAPWSVALRIGAVAVLLGIGLRGLVRVGRHLRDRSDAAGAGDPARSRARRTEAGQQLLPTYGRFLGLTLLNPATVVYFAALVLALPVLDDEPFARAAFVLGAFAASLSWQTVIAAVGAVAHHRLPPGFQLGISLLGNLVICGLAVALGRSLVTG
jgi:threonine/homoserine/homoserine lactone efflux protein